MPNVILTRSIPAGGGFIAYVHIVTVIIGKEPPCDGCDYISDQASPVSPIIVPGQVEVAPERS